MKHTSNDLPQVSLGELWLRGKLEAHTPESFHRVDPPLLYAAATDVLRALDTLREEVMATLLSRRDCSQ